MPPTRINNKINCMFKIYLVNEVLCRRKSQRETPYETYIKSLPPSPIKTPEQRKEIKKYKSLTTGKSPIIRPSNYLQTLMIQLNEIVSEEGSCITMNSFVKLNVTELCKVLILLFNRKDLQLEYLHY